jgi:hypothetical protein
MNTTTEPVAVGATLEGALHAVILATFTVLTVFDWWHPTAEQTGAIAALYAAFVVLVKAVVAVWQRSKVTPVATAAAAVDDAHRAGLAQGAVSGTGPVTLTSWRQGRP